MFNTHGLISHQASLDEKDGMKDTFHVAGALFFCLYEIPLGFSIDSEVASSV